MAVATGCEFPLHGGSFAKAAASSGASAASAAAAVRNQQHQANPVAPQPPKGALSIRYGNLPTVLVMGHAVSYKPKLTGQFKVIFSEQLLPNGLLIDPATGELSGTPIDAADIQSYTITGFDAAGRPTSTSLRFSVEPDPSTVPGYHVPKGDVVSFVEGAAAELDINVQGPSGSVYSADPGLPGGLSVDPATGRLSGVPKAALPATPMNFHIAAPGGRSWSETIAISVATVHPQGLIVTSGMGCSMLTNGAVSCWGTSTDALVAQHVAGVTGASLLASDTSTSKPTVCALTGDNSVTCWHPSESPSVYQAFKNVRQLVRGSFQTCVSDDKNAVYCANSKTDTPVQVPSLKAMSLAASGERTCAVRSPDGAVLCWGLSFDPARPGFATAPSQVTGLTGASQVSIGHAHACAVLSDGGVKCWGDGSEGQLGNGSTSSSLVPVAVALPKPAKSVAAGGFFTCAALVDGTVECWGSAGDGELGRVGHDNCQGAGGKGHVDCALTAGPVPGLHGVSAVAAGPREACAVSGNSDGDGQVYCWGGRATSGSPLAQPRQVSPWR